MVAWNTLVRMIAILAAFLVLLFVIVVPLVEQASEIGESSSCGLKMWLFAIQKKVSMGLSTPKTPSECRAQIIVIDEDSISDNLDLAKEAIERYKKDPVKHGEALQFFDDSDSSRWEWAVDKIIADAIYDCWSKKASFGAVDTTSLLTEDTTCLHCSLIKFDNVDKIKEKITPKRPFIADKSYIGSLGAFLRAELVGLGNQKQSYDYWINNDYQFYPLNEIPYKVDSSSEYSVVYVMTKDSQDIPLIGDVQKTWIELLPSKYLTSSYDFFFGRSHKACDKVIG